MSAQDMQSQIFRSTRIKVIAFAVIGILALSGAGALAGALWDAKSLPLEGSEIGVDSSGAPKPDGTSQAPRGQIQASPIPTETPPGAPSPSPAPSPTGDPGTGGQVAILGGGLAQIPVPPPWQGEVAPDGSMANFFSGQGDWVWAQVGQVDPTQNDAASLLSLNLAGILPVEYYTQLQTSEIASQAPFGTLLSVANMAYKALWVDPQSSFPVFGNIWMAVRQDGAVLVMSAESTPEDRFAAEVWRPLIDGGFTSFAFPNG
jgi:hypothetical protein